MRFKVGDEVYNILYPKLGKVVDINLDDYASDRMRIKWEGVSGPGGTYTLDGRLYPSEEIAVRLATPLDKLL